MKKLVFAIVIVFLLAACDTHDDMELKVDATSDAQHIGKIIRKSKNTILVEELVSVNGQPLGKIWVSINDETEIVDSEGTTIKFAQLKKGQLVEVWNNGIILESDPAKTKALKIKIGL
ncbi:DUF3221 domain-containing protein [Sutcliffiella cohnii]